VERSIRQREPGVNFVENHDVAEKITLYQAPNQSQAQNAFRILAGLPRESPSCLFYKEPDIANDEWQNLKIE